MNCFNCYSDYHECPHHEQEGKADSKVSIVEDYKPMSNGSTNISTMQYRASSAIQDMVRVEWRVEIQMTMHTASSIICGSLINAGSPTCMACVYATWLTVANMVQFASIIQYRCWC